MMIIITISLTRARTKILIIIITRRHSQSANLHHRGKQNLNTYWSYPAKAHQNWSKTLRDIVVTA